MMVTKDSHSEDCNVTRHRVESLEARLDKHITDVSVRLDKLIDLTVSLSTISEKQTRNQSDIDDVRSRINHEEIINRDSVVRLHARMDELKAEMDDNHRGFEKWLNRGWGAWAVAVILFSVLQYFVQSSVEDYRTHSLEFSTAIKKVETRLGEIESIVTMLAARK